MKILAIGEIIFDILDGEAAIGGAPLNFCAHCSLLGAESAIISAIGRDDLGSEAVDNLRKFGVKTDFVQKNDLPTGRCIVTVNNGNPSYDVVYPTAYDRILYTNELNEKIKDYNADIFAFGTLIQRDGISRNAVVEILENCSFGEIFCDVNLRPNCYERESCLLCLENATILKISEEEEPLLADFGFYKSSDNEKEKVLNICSAFSNIKLVLFTKGENGSIIYDSNSKKFYEISAVKTDVVSTVGAGDSYSAAFLCEYMKSGDIIKAAEEGSMRSSYVVSHREAIPFISVLVI